MDKQLTYQKAILAFLEDYATIKPSDWKNVQNQVIIDRDNHHYQLSAHLQNRTPKFANFAR